MARHFALYIPITIKQDCRHPHPACIFLLWMKRSVPVRQRRLRMKATMTSACTAILPMLAGMVSRSNEAETLHTLEDAPLEQSGWASGLERICPLTFRENRPVMNAGVFTTHFGMYWNVSPLWERHVRPTWGYGLSARSGGVRRLSGCLTEFGFWLYVFFWLCYRNYAPFYWCTVFSLTPVGPIIVEIQG